LAMRRNEPGDNKVRHALPMVHPNAAATRDWVPDSEISHLPSDHPGTLLSLQRLQKNRVKPLALAHHIGSRAIARSRCIRPRVAILN
jgi:hypothetical protein